MKKWIALLVVLAVAVGCQVPPEPEPPDPPSYKGLILVVLTETRPLYMIVVTVYCDGVNMGMLSAPSGSNRLLFEQPCGSHSLSATGTGYFPKTGDSWPVYFSQRISLTTAGVTVSWGS